MNNKYAAYIDLIGIRNIATSNTKAYYKKLTNFQDYIVDRCISLSEDGHVYLFSDSAFIEDSSANNVFDFISNLRTDLLIDNSYFRCSIIDKGLQQKGFNDVEGLSPKRKDILSGFWFNETAASLVIQEETFKGIGISIADSVVKKIKNKSLISKSWYVTQSNTREVRKYHDLKLKKRDLTYSNFERIVKHMVQAANISKRLGRYYVSLIINWIQSLDFVDLRFSGDTNSEGDTRTIFDIILSKKFRSLSSDIIGLEYVIYASINMIYSNRSNCPEAQQYWLQIQAMLSKNKVFSHGYPIPEELLCLAAREEIADEISKKILE